MSEDGGVEIVKGLCKLCKKEHDHFLYIDWWEKGKNYKKLYCCRCYSIIKLAECLAIKRANPEYFANLEEIANKLLDSGIIDFGVTVIDNPARDAG